MDLRSAVTKVNKRGMLLVFPINNKKEPPSLWNEFYPRSEMRWEWDDGGDNRVGQLWHLREQLSTSGKVVYTKWFRGRATLISFELFSAMVRILAHIDERMSFQAREQLDLLLEDSPLSTKTIKKLSGLQGRELEKVYVASQKELWSKLLIVAFGEVDEGSFPSIAIGATQVLFEDLWSTGHAMSEADARATIDKYMPLGTAFRKYFDQVEKAALSAVD